MKIKNLVTITIVALTALAGTSLLLAEPPGGPGFGPGPGMGRGPGRPDGPGFGFGPRIARMLELSDEQIAQLKAQREQFFEANAELREQLKAKHEELRALWGTEAPDREAILAKMAEIDPLRAQMRERHVDQRLSLLEVLTPEQRATLVDKMEKLHQFRREFGPKRGPHGRGHGRRGPGWGGPEAEF